MNEITVIPIGGLANRMRAVASGLSLARAYGKNLSVLWHKDPGLFADFHNLFLTDNLPFKLTDVSSFSYDFFYDVPRKKNFYFPLILNLWDNKKRIYHTGSKEPNQEEIEKGVTSGKPVIILSGLEFYPYDYRNLKDLFIPSRSVVDRISEILKGENPDIAIQIRRTDNKNSILYSPLNLFEEKIKEEIKNENSKIFLATDSEEIKRNLNEKYPGNIIINPRPARRNTLDGIIDAAAEMYIMSRCKKIYGSFYSSFSELASQLSSTPLLVLKT